MTGIVAIIVLTYLWPWSLIAFFALSIADLGIAIFANDLELINVLPPFIFGLLFLTIVVRFAYDIQRAPVS